MRYCVYIDGFNVYYALRGSFPHYKWLNYRKLAASQIGGRDTLESVVYFTSLVAWRPDSVRRHKVYIRALRSARVDIVQGRFTRKNATCHHCHRAYLTHEEKRTDVNIALRVVEDAVCDRFDRALIVSADSDLVPVIDTVHRIAPDKEIGIMLPIGRSGYDLKRAADFTRRMKERLLRTCQFPETICVGSGRITRPAQWAR